MSGWWLIAIGGVVTVGLPQGVREARRRVSGPFLRPKLVCITVCWATGACVCPLVGMTQLGLVSALLLGLRWAAGISIAACLLAFLVVAFLDLLGVLAGSRTTEHRT